MIRSYTLYFFTEDNSVEMDDIKNRRKFLKRVPASNVELSALFIGATVNVLGRHLTVVAFADDFTRDGGAIGDDWLVLDALARGANHC